MLIQEIFAEDVTRDIAPVVYFHENDPQKVMEEVSEYIITGGYPESDPRHKKMPSGIHEQFVRLLTGLTAELNKKHGVELPASWISGFYGSGKSSFAKLFGLALDGLTLPDQRPLSEALLERDDSPKSAEFRDAWKSLSGRIDPLAVVFDIGTVARENENVHSAVKRNIQARLGYCTVSHHVADYELKLELDGKWDEFMSLAEKAIGRSWDEAKSERLAADYFSKLIHTLSPDLYIDPMSWIDSRSGDRSGIGSSVEETTQAISDMLNIRASGKTLFVIVDEVSQYIHQNEYRMLKLQSFVSDLGKKLKGRVWLVATGQQKLEDEEEKTVLGKLKDRFPPRLRVHLASTNIRDVVHKRLLKKSPTAEPELRKLFQAHRSDLKLYAYSCKEITEEDFTEVYPLLPGHVDLLMDITSGLTLRSSRVKGDDYAIRGLLQLLGELFRELKFGEKALGELIALDQVYDIQHTALDADIQNTLAQIFAHEDVSGDDDAVRAAKAVSLLELVQEKIPTTTELVAQCLYARIGMGNRESAIRNALDKLCGLGLLSYSEKHGYKIQSAAGQEWQRERDAIGVTREESMAIICEKLKELVGGLERPTYKKKGFLWAAFFSDAGLKQDERLHVPTDPAVVTVDFRFLKGDDRSHEKWIQASDSALLRDRLIWVCGKLGTLDADIKQLAKSRAVLNRYNSHVQSLSRNKQRLYMEEQTRCEGLEKTAKEAVARAFMDGEIYFRGRTLSREDHGKAFAARLTGSAKAILSELYGLYVDIAVSPGELNQLLEPQLSGPSQKFMAAGLGILDLDAGKYAPSCNGETPSRILQYIRENTGASGTVLLNEFGKPPYGYPPDVVKACLAGLLRAGKIRIRPDAGPEITSVRDPGVKDMFQKDRDLKRADILPPVDQGINPRDRIAICNFFKTYLDVDPDRENDAIADSVFQQFPTQMTRVQELEKKFNSLPEKPDLPQALTKLKKALEDCKRSRHVEPTVLAVKKNIDTLRDGVQQLNLILTELTEDNINAIVRAMTVLNHQAAQLMEINALESAEESVQKVEAHLKLERPWRDIKDLNPLLKIIEDRYQEVRLSLIERQEQKAHEIRERIKQRKGFEKLNADQSHTVLRPITEALYNTDPKAVKPVLQQLRDSVVARLKDAEEEADALLDDFLSKIDKKQVVPVKHQLGGREISSPEELDQLLKELRERLLAQLKDEKRIRLI